MNTTPLLRFTLTAALAASLLVSVGCKTEGRRIGVNTTTEAELNSPEVLPTALMEFSSQAPQRLVADLQGLPVIQELAQPATIILGDINNKTGIVSSNDFELAMQRLRNRLINSGITRGELSFVEPRARLGRIAAREQVQGAEGAPAGPAAYDASSTFALTGDFMRLGRGDVNQYYMQFQLVHFGTNQIVWSDSYEVKQIQGED